MLTGTNNNRETSLEQNIAVCEAFQKILYLIEKYYTQVSFCTEIIFACNGGCSFI